MEKAITRKQFMSNSTKLAATFAAGVAGMGVLSHKDASGKTVTYEWPWPYAQLDPEKVRVYGHDNFWNGKACCAGAFGGVLMALQETVGEPFTLLPMEIMLFGHGGGVGWGTICGALNGASAAISLVCDKATSDKLINELLGWYTQAEFPSDESNAYAVNHTFTDNRCDVQLAQNLCGSPLCHISVTEWCNAAEKQVGDLERKERCARLAGDVAAHAAQLLNAEFAGQFESVYIPPESIAGCMSCHGSGFVANVAAKMACTQCHGDDPHTPTTDVSQSASRAKTFTLDQNFPNPFNPETNIQFSIPKLENVNVAIYDIRGRLIRTLIDHQLYSPGSYTLTWDGKDSVGQRVASGVYFTKLQAGRYSQTKKMTLAK
jgi:hypothetical protein